MRATNAFLPILQIASMAALEKGLSGACPANTNSLLLEDLMDSKALWLNLNTVSAFIVAWMEQGDEPMVMKTGRRTSHRTDGPSAEVL